MLKRLLSSPARLCAACIVIMATCITCMASAQQPSEAYFTLVGKADKAIADSKFAQAIDYLRDAMRMEPDSPMNILLLSNIGMLQHYAGQDTLAIETLSEAHRRAPSSVTVLQNRARVYTAMGKPLNALRDYSRVIALDSTLVDPLYYHAMISFTLGDDSTSIADIHAMKRRFPAEQATLLAEANYLTLTAHYSEAIPLLTKLTQSHPTATDYASLALCHLMTDHLAEASESISRGLELDPTDGDLYLYRAMLNKARFRPDDARADAQKARLYGVSAQRIKELQLQ